MWSGLVHNVWPFSRTQEHQVLFVLWCQDSLSACEGWWQILHEKERKIVSWSDSYVSPVVFIRAPRVPGFFFHSFFFQQPNCPHLFSEHESSSFYVALQLVWRLFFTLHPSPCYSSHFKFVCLKHLDVVPERLTVANTEALTSQVSEVIKICYQEACRFMSVVVLWEKVPPCVCEPTSVYFKSEQLQNGTMYEKTACCSVKNNKI